MPRYERCCAAGAAFFVVIASTVLPARAQPVAAALPAIAIENFGKINDRYYRGSQPRPSDVRALAALGVKTLIDLAEEGDPLEGRNAKAAGMNFVRIPMSTHKAPSAETIAQFLALVNDPANQPVFVHCIGGRHRTGVMTAIYRMSVDGWQAARAWTEVKRYKYGADVLHPEFKAFISTYVPAPVTALPSRAR